MSSKCVVMVSASVTEQHYYNILSKGVYDPGIAEGVPRIHLVDGVKLFSFAMQ